MKKGPLRLFLSSFTLWSFTIYTFHHSSHHLLKCHQQNKTIIFAIAFFKGPSKKCIYAVLQIKLSDRGSRWLVSLHQVSLTSFHEASTVSLICILLFFFSLSNSTTNNNTFESFGMSSFFQILATSELVDLHFPELFG